MPAPSQIGYYRQHMDVMDMAEVNPSGVEVRFDSRAKATRWRQMAYTARKLFVERTGDETKWAGLSIQGPKQDGAEWFLLVAHAPAEPIGVVARDGQYEVESSLDKHLQEMRAVEESAAAPAREVYRPTIEPPPVSRRGGLVE